jgi:hypothetical protein
LRNVVERIIGVLKKRFRIIAEANDYPMEMQAKLMPALCALHNFIRIYDPADDMDITEEEIESAVSQEQPASGTYHSGIAAAETARAAERRDQIAQQMWASYCAVLEHRNQRRREERARDGEQAHRINEHMRQTTT